MELEVVEENVDGIVYNFVLVLPSKDKPVDLCVFELGPTDYPILIQRGRTANLSDKKALEEYLGSMIQDQNSPLVRHLMFYQKMSAKG